MNHEMTPSEATSSQKAIDQAGLLMTVSIMFI
jgi:hypothetical protein